MRFADTVCAILMRMSAGDLDDAAAERGISREQLAAAAIAQCGTYPSERWVFRWDGTQLVPDTPHCGLNADWSSRAWDLGDGLFLVDDEDHPDGRMWTITHRVWDDEEGSCEDEILYEGDLESVWDAYQTPCRFCMGLMGEACPSC